MPRNVQKHDSVDSDKDEQDHSEESRDTEPGLRDLICPEIVPITGFGDRGGRGVLSAVGEVEHLVAGDPSCRAFARQVERLQATLHGVVGGRVEGVLHGRVLALHKTDWSKLSWFTEFI